MGYRCSYIGRSLQTLLGALLVTIFLSVSKWFLSSDVHLLGLPCSFFAELLSLRILPDLALLLYLLYSTGLVLWLKKVSRNMSANKILPAVLHCFLKQSYLWSEEKSLGINAGDGLAARPSQAIAWTPACGEGINCASSRPFLPQSSSLSSALFTHSELIRCPVVGRSVHSRIFRCLERTQF